ncbi:HEPN domain-containing protein [Candidatus Bathyarchaeota archaeon]|nr:HEPN domain-containing protein [Candidatus Bathyarchaeota archaeon]
MSGESIDVSLVTAEEVLKYAEEEFEKAVKTKDIVLYRDAVDKAFLSMVVAVNSYIHRKLNVMPKSHGERRYMLRKMGREDLRALYSDVMKTLHDEAFYEGVYNPEEAEYAIKQVKKMFEELEKG